MVDAKRILRLNFKAYLADTGKLYDTTYEDVAKEAGIFVENITYKPLAYVVGYSSIYPIIDKAISEAKVGEEFTVEVPCEDGPGVRNPKLMEIHKIHEFKDMDAYPQPGMSFSFGNRKGTVLKVGAGRVVVDFNNPLAGHDLKYVITVTEEVKEDKAKAEAVVESAFGLAEGFVFSFPGDKVVVTTPDIVRFSKEWMSARFRVVPMLRDVFGVDTVEFVDVWTIARKAEPASDEKEEAEKKE